MIGAKKCVYILGLITASSLIGSAAMAAGKQIAPRLTMSEARAVPARPSGYSRGPALAFGAGKYLLVYQDGYNGVGGDSNILGIFLDAKGEPAGKPFEICTAEGAQDSPAAAFCGGKFLVTWCDFRSGKDYDLCAALVDPSGGVGKEVVLAGGPSGQVAPAVASDGRDTFLVVWQDHRGGKQFEIFGARVSAAGKALDPEGVRLLDAGALPAVAFSEGKFLVQTNENACLVGLDGKPGAPIKLWAGRVNAGASVKSAYGKGLAILNTNPFPDSWGWGGPGAIIGVSVTPEGVSPEMLAMKQGRFGNAALADRQVPWVLEAARWKDRRGWPAGAPGGFKGTQDGTWPSGRTAVAFNGRSVLVAWTTANFMDILRLRNRDICLKRVLDGWHAVDETSLRIVAGPTEEANPVLASDGAGGAILAWERQDPGGGVLVEHAFLHEGANAEQPVGPPPGATH